MAVTPEELRILAAWQFPGRLEAVVVAVIDYQSKRNTVTLVVETTEQAKSLVEQAEELRDRLHPNQQTLVDTVRKDYENELKKLAATRTGLAAANDRLMDAAGNNNAHALLDFFEDHQWQATRDQLIEFLLDRVSA